MKPHYYNFLIMTSLLQNPNEPPSAKTMAARRDPQFSTNHDLTPSKLNPGRAGTQANMARLPRSILPSFKTAKSVTRPTIPSDYALTTATPSSITDLGRSSHQENGAQKEGALIFIINLNNHPDDPSVPSDKSGRKKRLPKTGRPCYCYYYC